MKNSDVYKKILVDYLLTIIMVLGIIFVIPKVLGFFWPFVVGWIIAMIANPLVKMMENRLKILRKHSSAVVIVLALAIVVGVLYLGCSFLARQVYNLIQDMPRLYQEMEVQIMQISDNMQQYYRILPAEAQEFVASLGTKLLGALGKIVSGISTSDISAAGHLVKNVADVLFMLVITVLSAYFLLRDKEKIVTIFQKTTPDFLQEKWTMLVGNFIKAFTGYFKAQFKIMLVVVFILFVGLCLLKIEYAILIALGIGFLDFLPVFGTGTVLWPWILWEVISGNYFRAVCLAILYLVCQLFHQLVQPKMVGDSIGISPLSTLVFMFIGYRIKGVLGMIIGIPIGMALVNFYKEGVFDYLIDGAKILAKGVSEYRKRRP